MGGSPNLGELRLILPLANFFGVWYTMLASEREGRRLPLDIMKRGISND